MKLICRIAYSSAALFGVMFFSQSISFADGSDALAGDVRCAVVGIKASESSTSAVRVAGQITALFYLGRVDAQAPAGRGDKMISDALAAITDATLHTEAVRCGNDLSLKGQWLERLGKAFSETR